MNKHAAHSDWPWWAVAVVLGIVGAAAMAAGCDTDTRCDPNQRLYHGLCYVIDAGGDAGAGSAAAITPPGWPDTPPDPRSGSGG